MKKVWTEAECLELSIHATANQPTTELKADDVITGVGLKQGVADGSGPEYPIPYFPAGGGRTEIIYTPSN